MSDANDQCLFFDAKGNGPSEVRLIPREIREERDGDQIVVPRAFGLCWEVSGLLHFVEGGGFMLTDDVAAWLRDRLTAHLELAPPAVVSAAGRQMAAPPAGGRTVWLSAARLERLAAWPGEDPGAQLDAVLDAAARKIDGSEA